MKSRWLPLILFLVLAFAAAGIGSLATSSSVDTWYDSLQKPAWNPPKAVFGPVWTVLYILMAISTWRVWRVGDPLSARVTVMLYALQLALNALWSILFFGRQSPGAALVDILALWLLLTVIFIRFWTRDRIAAAMWAPYLLWVSFATALNSAIWKLNS